MCGLRGGGQRHDDPGPWRGWEWPRARPLADAAASLGWRVLAPDLPGYGLTRPAPGYRGDYDEWPAIVAQLADETDGPVVLMGLSAGGMTAVFAAEAARTVDGVIVTTLLDAGDPAMLMRAARWRWLGPVAAGLRAHAVADRPALAASVAGDADAGHVERRADE